MLEKLAISMIVAINYMAVHMLFLDLLVTHGYGTVFDVKEVLMVVFVTLIHNQVFYPFSFSQYIP